MRGGISSKTIGVVRFPGTNCDRDVFKAVEDLGARAIWWWHENHYDASSVSALVIPGGFSYGDYLRAGALASRSPVMKSVVEAASMRKPILGICNGFQILCESGLLPGVLVKNENLRFVDRWVPLHVEPKSKAEERFKFNMRSCVLPVAHGMGRFVMSADAELNRLEEAGQVWLRYTENPNGASRDIAGVCSEEGHVLALMPHPERAMAPWMGGVDGQKIMHALLEGA